MAKGLTVKDLQRLAIAKHGENEAWAKAYFIGDARHRKVWHQVLEMSAMTAEEKLSHQIWQPC
jgi:hypothetical protein